MDLEGFVRRFARSLSAPRTLRLTNLESLAVAQVEPDGAELARAGLRFYGGGQGSATGRAPVASIPTTAAAWELWNGEPAGGKSYFIEAVTIAQISGTAAVGGVILAAITNTAVASPTAASNYATSSASKGSQASKAVWADNQTLGATPTWLMLAGNGNPATTTNGGATADVKGRLCIPPGYALALHYLSGAGTTPLFVASAIWSELALDLE